MKVEFWKLVLIVIVIGLAIQGARLIPRAEAQQPTAFITDVEHAVDADGTGSFTPARPSPCMIIKNEDGTATNSVTVTQTFESGGASGTFVLRGGETLTLGCSDRYPMFTKSLSWEPDAGNPDVRVIAWEL